MSRCLSIWMLFAVLAMAIHGAERKEDLAAAGMAEFIAAYGEWDGARFEAAADWFEKAVRLEPNSSLCFYWLGAAQFHRMLQLQKEPGVEGASKEAEALAARSMDAALVALQRAVDLDAGHAESHALLGTLYGMKINGSLIRAVRYGARVQTHCHKAMELGPKNARVRYLLGTCQFHTAKNPTDQREALASFLVAEKLFQEEAQRAAGALEPRWGRSTCLTFIGRSYERLGEKDQAKEYFRKALALHPSHRTAAEGLARISDKK